MKKVISVKKLSKKYQLKDKHYYYTLRDSLTEVLKNPLGLMSSKKMKNEFWALKDVTFDVNEGEIFGIIGLNGAGKSTLLKTMSRITPPTRGELRLNGRLGSLLEIGTGFHPELSGRENIYLNGAILGMSKEEINQKFDEIVRFAEVEKFLDTAAKHYSSGMYMRLAFSVAAHLQSEILLVDEVLSVGDVEFQKKCLNKMDVIAHEGRTVLFVSHNMVVMENLCDRIMWLDKGKVKMIGNSRDVVSAYLKSVEKQNNLPLINKPRPKEATQEAQIIGVSISQPNHRAGQHLFKSNLPLKIDLQINSKTKIETGVWIAIKDEYQRSVLNFSSGHMSHQQFKLKPGKNVITCLTKPTMLSSGHYSLECGLLYPNKPMIDLIDDAIRFTIGSYDPYKKSFDYSQKFGTYFVDHAWKIK